MASNISEASIRLAEAAADAEEKLYEKASTRTGRRGLGFNTSCSVAVSVSGSDLFDSCSLSSSSSFSAASYLSRFGWKAGTGLGKNRSGVASYLKIARKDDTAGIGSGKHVDDKATRSFEQLFNNASRAIKIQIDDSSSSEEEDGDKTDRGIRDRKKQKKRDSREEPQPPAISTTPSTTDFSSFSSSSAIFHPRISGFVRGRIGTLDEVAIDLIQNTVSDIDPNRRETKIGSDAGLGRVKGAVEKVLEFDRTRKVHMYHDRSSGKQKRIQEQEKTTDSIVQAIAEKIPKHLKYRGDRPLWYETDKKQQQTDQIKQDLHFQPLQLSAAENLERQHLHIEVEITNQTENGSLEQIQNAMMDKFALKAERKTRKAAKREKKRKEEERETEKSESGLKSNSSQVVTESLSLSSNTRRTKEPKAEEEKEKQSLIETQEEKAARKAKKKQEKRAAKQNRK